MGRPSCRRSAKKDDLLLQGVGAPHDARRSGAAPASPGWRTTKTATADQATKTSGAGGRTSSRSKACGSALPSLPPTPLLARFSAKENPAPLHFPPPPPPPRLSLFLYLFIFIPARLSYSIFCALLLYLAPFVLITKKRAALSENENPYALSISISAHQSMSGLHAPPPCCQSPLLLLLLLLLKSSRFEPRHRLGVGAEAEEATSPLLLLLCCEGERSLMARLTPATLTCWPFAFERTSGCHHSGLCQRALALACSSSSRSPLPPPSPPFACSAPRRACQDVALLHASRTPPCLTAAAAAAAAAATAATASEEAPTRTTTSATSTRRSLRGARRPTPRPE